MKNALMRQMNARRKNDEYDDNTRNRKNARRKKENARKKNVEKKRAGRS